MRIENSLLWSTEVAQNTNGTAQNLDHIFGWSASEVVTVTTPAAKTFVDANVSVANDTITITGHGFQTGLVGQLTTTGTLPGGLATSTNYFVIIVDANTISLASSLVNANAGTKIDITSAAGGGTHTFTSTAIASASIKWQGCNDLNGLTTDTWIDLAAPASQSITVTNNFLPRDTDTHYKWVRPVLSLASGQIKVAIRFNGKGV